MGKYLEAWANLKEQNRVLLVLVAFLLAGLIGMTGMVGWVLSRKEVVIYMPPYHEVKVGSREYVQLWARVFAEYLGNVDPDTVEKRAAFLRIYAYGPLKDRILSEAIEIKKNRITQQFIPLEGTWELDPQKKEVRVKGRLKRWIGTELVESRVAELTMVIHLISGRPSLVAFNFD